MMTSLDLSFPFRGRQIPVTYSSPAVSRELAELALKSGIFSTWYRRCEKEVLDPGMIMLDDLSCAEGTPHSVSVRKRIEIRGVEIQSVDLFGSR